MLLCVKTCSRGAQRSTDVPLWQSNACEAQGPMRRMEALRIQEE